MKGEWCCTAKLKQTAFYLFINETDGHQKFQFACICVQQEKCLTRRWLSWSLSPLQSSSGCGPPSQSADPPGCCVRGFLEGCPLSYTHTQIHEQTHRLSEMIEEKLHWVSLMWCDECYGVIAMNRNVDSCPAESATATTGHNVKTWV